MWFEETLRAPPTRPCEASDWTRSLPPEAVSDQICRFGGGKNGKLDLR